jgi:hypothetical protein
MRNNSDKCSSGDIRLSICSTSAHLIDHSVVSSRKGVGQSYASNETWIQQEINLVPEASRNIVHKCVHPAVFHNEVTFSLFRNFVTFFFIKGRSARSTRETFHFWRADGQTGPQREKGKTIHGTLEYINPNETLLNCDSFVARTETWVPETRERWRALASMSRCILAAFTHRSEGVRV